MGAFADFASAAAVSLPDSLFLSPGQAYESATALNCDQGPRVCLESLVHYLKEGLSSKACPHYTPDRLHSCIFTPLPLPLLSFFTMAQQGSSKPLRAIAPRMTPGGLTPSEPSPSEDTKAKRASMACAECKRRRTKVRTVTWQLNGVILCTIPVLFLSFSFSFDIDPLPDPICCFCWFANCRSHVYWL